MQLRSVIGAIGRFMMRLGLVILLFVAFQLWGTGITTSLAQDRLTREFDSQLAEVAPPSTSTSTAPSNPTPIGPPPTVTSTQDLPVPALGDPIARIRIESIGTDFIMLQGVDLKWLKEGPGHFPQTPFPGEPGNVAVAGHRTTYKAPFNRIDELVPGDVISVQTVQGTFTYLVDAHIDPSNGETAGHFIVSPNDLWILDQTGDNRLTLMACHPEFTAAQRIVVTATLASTPAASTPIPAYDGVTTDASSDALADGDPSAWPAVILWSMLTVIVWFLVWWLARFWTPSLQRARAARVSRLTDWKFLTTYAIGTPIVLVTMFFAFTAISRLLPASY